MVAPKVTLSHSVYASLAYRYWNSGWSHEENRRRYGRQASPEGLGGNWKLEIGGRVGEAELAAPLARMKALLDHRCLFTDIPEFRDAPSTLENVTGFLARQFLGGPWDFLTVHESERLSCTAYADGNKVLRIHVLNLTLDIKSPPDESGLMTSREQVTQAVIDAHARFGNASDLSELEWSQSLFEILKQSVKGLTSVRVDLGSGKYIVVG